MFVQFEIVWDSGRTLAPRWVWEEIGGDRPTGESQSSKMDCDAKGLGNQNCGARGDQAAPTAPTLDVFEQFCDEHGGAQYPHCV